MTASSAFQPEQFQPKQWKAPAAPPRVRQKQGDRAISAVHRIDLPGEGPEDVVVDGTGQLLCGVADGRILRVSRDGNLIEVVGHVDGRPLGLEALPDGHVLICVDTLGIVRLDPEDGGQEVVVDEIEGERHRFWSNVVQAADGTLYFSVSSRRYGLGEYRDDILEHSGTGLLARLAPGGKAEILLDGLQFANGVALAPDEQSVIVAETGAYQLQRYWLSGPKQGRADVLIDNLPGFPDNISRGPSGLIWVTLASPRDAVLDRLHRAHPRLKRIANAVPEKLQPQPRKTAWVVGVDLDGRIVRDLQADKANYSFVTGVVEYEGALYVGSLLERAIGVLPLD